VTVHDCWRDVAIALMSSLADAGADPLDPAVIAYNHARNDRTVDASVWAAHAIAGAGSHANDVDYPAPGPEARIRPVEGAPGVIPPRLIVEHQRVVERAAQRRAAEARASVLRAVTQGRPRLRAAGPRLGARRGRR